MRPPKRVRLGYPFAQCPTAAVGTLRRLQTVFETVTPRSSITIAHGRRSFSTEEIAGEETQWTRLMCGRYGTGNYLLFRALYKDLCDEVRREYYTRPPPPLAAGARLISALEVQTDYRSVSTASPGESHCADVASSLVSPTSAGGMPAASAGGCAADGAGQLSQSTTAGCPPSPPEEIYGDGSWSVQHRPEDNVVVFHRDAVEAGRLAAVYAWARIELKDPPRLNAVLTFVDWTPIEVCVERNGVIIHFSMASNEGGMHMRNVRVYAPKSLEERAALLDPSEDGECARKKFYYDGPCLWHLEQDMLNELYDVMQDHGVSLDWIRWASSWAFYLEHVNYARWNLGMLEELIPTSVRGPEEDFLLPVEIALLEEPVEDWLSAHSV